jgi:tetratricopeptide (TPR) repeat protein
MIRQMKRLLPLLLAAAFGHAHAALDATACKPGFGNLKPDAVQEASARLAAARSEPGERRFALADALADLALASARQNGSPDIATNGNPSASELLREALTIWTGATRSVPLAATLHARGVEFFNNRQCRLARELLEPALRLSSAASGPNDPESVAIAQDLLRIALSQNDGSQVRRLAPVVTPGLDARKRLLEPEDQQTVLALVGFFYSQPDNRDDLQQAEHLAQRGLALTPAGAPARRLFPYRLASIYYAQLRYADGEAVRLELTRGRPELAGRKDELGRQREELIALVRKGELRAARSMAKAMLEQRQEAFELSRQALARAEAAEAQINAQQDLALAKAARLQAVRTTGQARFRQTLDVFNLAETRSYLGEILHAMGDLDGAAAAYETALAVFAEGGSYRWQDRIRTRSDLAILYRTRGDVAHALALQQQVLDELLALVGEDHPDVKEARAELALLHKLHKLQKG